MACTRTEGLQNESFVPVLTMFNQEIHVFWIQHGVIWNSFSSKRHNNRQPWTTFLLSQPHFVPPAGDTCSVARDFSSGTQGCVYRGTDNHVWILVQSAESHWAWDARQVTPVPICSSNPTTESAEGTFWVAYIGSDLNVYVANSNCKTPWNISQLTTTCLATGNPSITLSPWTQHIMYLSLDGQVREIHRGAYNSYKWTEKIHSELPPASMCPQMSICRDNRKMFSKHILEKGIDNCLYESHHGDHNKWVWTTTHHTHIPFVSHASHMATTPTSKHMFVVGTEGKIYEIHQGAYNRWRWDCFCISDAIPSIKPPASLPQVKKSDQMTAITYRTSDGELVVLAALAQQRWTWFSEVIPMIPSPAWRPDSTNLCDVCMENPKNVVLLPCRHMLCLNCSKSLSNCPHCRETIVDRMTVFL